MASKSKANNTHLNRVRVLRGFAPGSPDCTQIPLRRANDVSSIGRGVRTEWRGPSDSGGSAGREREVRGEGMRNGATRGVVKEGGSEGVVDGRGWEGMGG